jgi:cytochrome c
MKRIFIPAIVVTALFSCGGGETKDAADSKPAAAETPAANPLEDKALAAIAKSDCMTCHKINETVTGPAYAEVAKKYENTDANVNMLVEKVLKGGKGNWGEVPMLAHTSLDPAEAKIIVQYILSLRK